MKRTTLLAALTAATLLQGCADKPTSGAPPAPATAVTAPAPASTPPAPATAAPATAAPAPPTGSAAGGRVYDCGAKGQKPCPMQAWMKKVMASASSSEEGEPLAKALTYVADHAPPGYSEWVSIARAGATRAKAGDVDGAKASCKPCHDAYKERYKAEMRDRPF
jgi:hypothetical protein